MRKSSLSRFSVRAHQRKTSRRTLGAEQLEDRSLLAVTVQLVSDIRPGAPDSMLGALPIVGAGGQAFFSANNGATGQELWKTDGTAAGTALVRDIQPGISGSTPGSLGAMAEFNGNIFFSASTTGLGSELWKSDGTTGGTVLVKDINTSGFLSGSYPAYLTNVNGTLFLAALDSANGTELWKSDGTAAGTVLIKDIRPGPFGSIPSSLVDLNGTVYFGAHDGTSPGLWKSDGTAAGTVPVVPSLGSTTPLFLTNVNGTLFFMVNDPTTGTELWKSDGTAAGTMIVKDINPGSAGSSPGSLVNVNGTLYFAATDPATGRELWKSDGTAAGTVLVSDINPGAANSNPRALANFNGSVFFAATTAAAGYELWTSDGTAAGTLLVADINPGAASSLPGALSNVNGTLFFSATDGVTGRELWKAVPANEPPLANNDVFAATEDTPLVIAAPGVLANDTDPNSDSLSAVSVDNPLHGTLSLNADGSFTYTPAANYSGPDSFTYRANDGQADSNIATVTINVAPVNDAPSGADRTVTTAEDTTYTLTVPDFGFSDPSDAPPNSLLAVRITTLPAAGTLTVNGVPALPGQVVSVFSILVGQVRFTPAPNANGLPYASFAFQVKDNGGTASGGADLDPSPNTLTINVTPVNDAPVAEDDTYSTSQGTPLTVPAPGVLGNDSDVDGDSLSAAVATGPSHGVVTLNADGSFTYTPDSTFSGTDTFTYTVDDGNGGTDTATVSINVAAAAPGSVTTITDSCLGGTALLIMGTSGNDSIVVTGAGPALTVIVNGVVHNVTAPSGRVIALGGSGDDTMVMTTVSQPVWLYGEEGIDVLNAGSGGSLLLGGDGNDQLLGGSGRDIMIGGEGADTLVANGNDDILVAGLTNFDSRFTAGHEEFWCDIWAEWTSTNSFTARVQNLRDGSGGNAHNNGSLLLPNVVDDVMAGSIDTLIGGTGSDWLLLEVGEDNAAGPAEATN